MRADFGFLVAVTAATQRDPSEVFSELAAGLMPPEAVRDVLVCAANDSTVDVEDLITRYGLQECAMVARVLLSHAMIGDTKKSAIGNQQALAEIAGLAPGSLSAVFWKAGWLWAASTATSTALVCLIFKLCAQGIS